MFECCNQQNFYARVANIYSQVTGSRVGFKLADELRVATSAPQWESYPLQWGSKPWCGISSKHLILGHTFAHATCLNWRPYCLADWPFVIATIWTFPAGIITFRVPQRCARTRLGTCETAWEPAPKAFSVSFLPYLPKIHPFYMSTPPHLPSKQMHHPPKNASFVSKQQRTSLTPPSKQTHHPPRNITIYMNPPIQTNTPSSLLASNNECHPIQTNDNKCITHQKKLV